MRASLIYTLVILASVCLLGSSSLVKTKVGLNTYGASSVIPVANFLADPLLNDKVITKPSGAFTSVIEGGISYDAHESFAQTDPGVFPQLVTYDVTGDDPVEIDRITLRNGTGCTNGGFSPSRGYAVSSISQSLGEPLNILAPHRFTLEFHNVIDGVFDPVPVVTDLSTLDPAFWGLTNAYNNLLAVSDDGKLVVVAYTVLAAAPCPVPPGLGLPPVFPLPFCNGDNMRIEVLRVNDDLTTTSVAKAIFPAPDQTILPGYQAQAQRAVLFEAEDGSYDLYVGANSWNLVAPTGPDLLGKSSRALYYKLDVDAETLDLIDSFWTPQFIESIDVDREDGFVYLALEEVGNDNGIYQIPLETFDNPAVDKTSELQVARISNGLFEYIGGEELDMFAVQVKVSHDGKTLALVTASDIDNEYYLSAASATGIPARRAAPNQVTLYEVKRKGTSLVLRPGDIAPAPPVAFALAFDECDEMLSVAGLTFFSNVGPFATGQKGKVLYTIEKSN